MDSPGHDRFLRSIGIISEKDLKKIRETSVAIGGLGLGGSIFLNLVRLGFEKFHVSDPDVYERTNINRQRMAKESTLGCRKDEVLIREALDVNPNVQVKTFPEGINERNVSDFLEGIDWVVDVVDVFALREKLALNNEAHRRQLPVVSCASFGFSAGVVVFDKHTPSFEKLSGMNPDDDYKINIRKFVTFLCPEVPEHMQKQLDRAMQGESYIPFVVPGVEFSAACAATEIVKQVVGLGRVVRAPQGIFIDSVNLKIEIFEANHQRGRLRKVA